MKPIHTNEIHIKYYEGKPGKYLCRCAHCQRMFIGAKLDVSCGQCTSQPSKADQLLSLVDGAYDLVELWRADSPAQIKWKKEWLANAKKLGAGPDYS